ncbi:MAG TPA: hypothetical protein VJN18_20200 [Polyangiaceae bacterium]|nr:hypothetical protein [Polyangiaceae bacterium]
MLDDSAKEIHRGELAGAGLLVWMALLACGAATDDQLKTRAAFDLSCPASKVSIVELDSATRGVTGCGQRATYVERCDAPPDNMARSCTWVLNNTSERPPMAPTK